uniref:(northern house mosquito) hypothetical protein n=1 Tax=Culex pipiens TaxID=7175 RepID=A0A8D8CN91_CULPI
MALEDWTSCRVTKGVTNRPLQRRNSEHPSISSVFHHPSGKLTRNRRKPRCRHEHSYFPAPKTRIPQPEQIVVVVVVLTPRSLQLQFGQISPSSAKNPDHSRINRSIMFSRGSRS